MSDDDWRPESYAASYAETTPSQRVIENSMSAAAKRRVDRATANLSGKRCLIENTDESNAVEYAHCLPRSTKHPLLDSLELAWNMPRFTLNVDTRANVIRLSSKFHKLFDSNRWLLLPETSIINIYNNARKKKQKIPNIDQPSYKYTVLAHPDMRLVPIHRQNSPPTDEDRPPLDFTFYPHPYHDFPVIVSHVHPRFVICNTGAKLNGSTEWPEDARGDDMFKVLNIWREWSQVVNRGQPDAQAFLKNSRNDGSDFGDDDSEHTTSHRRELRKRKRPEQQGSPTPAPKSSKQQRPADDGAWLDDETLHEFDQQTSTHVGEMGSKKRLILDWLNGVSTTGVKESVKGNKNALDVIMAFPGAFLEHF